MLEFNKDCYIKGIDDLKDFVTATYVVIDDIYQKGVLTDIKNRRNIEYSMLSNSEVIIISIVDEVLTIDSEKAWLLQWYKLLPYNKRCYKKR